MTHAIATIGIQPVIATPGTSSSVTFTMMSEMTNENSQSVISRRGKLIILRMVPSMRFTIASTTANISALTYPRVRAIPEIYPEVAMRNIVPALSRNDTI